MLPMLKRLRATTWKVLRRLGMTPPPPQLRLRFSTPEQFAGFLDDPRARRPFRVLEIRVDPWHAVRPDWTGRLGPLKEVETCRAAFDPEHRTASATITLRTPVEANEFVRAAYPLFYPVRPQTGWGGFRVGVLPGSPPDVRWNPGGGVRPAFPRKPPKRRYTDFDIVVDAAGEHRITDPAAGRVRIDRGDAPSVLIDPRTHRPVDRRQPSAKTLSATAAISGERLLLRAGDSVLVDAPATRSLTATELRRLELVTDVDLSGLGTGAVASARAAELAAYGAVAHTASAGLDLHPDLSALVSAPFARTDLLSHMNRSLAQVRAVMRGHTRAFTTGHLPAVSVILSTVRPDLLERILGQMAAQDHPNLEVVVGCHGFEAPAPESFSDDIRRILGPVLSFERTIVFGDVLAALSAAASGDFISKIDDDDWYGPSHITDLVIAWTYSEAQLVGKKLALIHFEETDTLVVRRFFLEGYRWQVAGGAAIISRHDLASVGGWRSQIRAVDRGLWTRLEDAGGLVYSCSGPGYIHVRHAEPHTWAVNDAHFQETYVEQTLQGIPPAAYGIM